MPSGVLGLKGNFLKGEPVTIIDPKGKEVAKGIVNFSSADLESVKGLQTSDISKVLGKNAKKEVIYSENIVILKK